MFLASEQLMGYGFANLLLNIGDMVSSALSFSTLDGRLWRCWICKGGGYSSSFISKDFNIKWRTVSSWPCIFSSVRSSHRVSSFLFPNVTIFSVIYLLPLLKGTVAIYFFPLKTVLSSFQLFILFWIFYLNREFEIDFVLLAGFLKLIPVELVRAYPKSILNIHPSLLPSFGGKGYYGLKVHKAVIASGARWETLYEFCVLDVCLCFGMLSSQELYFKAIWNLKGLN